MESGGHVSVSVLHEGPSCFTPQLPPSAPSYRSDTRRLPLTQTCKTVHRSFLLLLFWLLGGRGWGESDYSV